MSNGSRSIIRSKQEAVLDEQALLLFDLGNILFELDGVEAFWPELADEPEHCEELWSSSRYVKEFETGIINDFTDFYQLISEELDIKLNLTDFRRAFLGIIGKPFPGTDKMLRELAGKYEMMILSNTNEPHWQYCLNQLPLEKYFTSCFLSHRMGAMKPDRKIYEDILAAINASPENIYYFDDKQENVDAAKRYGMNAYKSWGGSQLMNKLRELGIIT